MPRIPTYTASPPQLSLWDIRGGRQADPQDMGGGVAAAAEGLGRGVQQTGNQLIGMQENDEQRKAIVASSEIRTRYAKQLMDAATNGADIDKIKTDMNDELSKVGDGFLTKRGVDTLAVTSSNDNLSFDQKANAIQVQRAALDARAQGQTFVNAETQHLQFDPSYLPQSLQHAEDLVNSFPGMSKERRAVALEDLKSQLTYSAAYYTGKKDPAGTRSALESGQYPDLKPAQRVELTHYMDSFERNQRLDARVADEEAKRQARETSDAAMNDYLPKIEQGQVKAMQIATDNSLLPETKKTLISWIEQRANAGDKLPKSNGAALADLQRRVALDPSNPQYLDAATLDTRVHDLVGRGVITLPDGLAVKNEQTALEQDKPAARQTAYIDGQVRNAFTQMGVMYSSPEAGAQAAINFHTDLARAVKASPNPMDTVLNPTSKDYFATPERIAQYGKTARETVRALAATAGGAELATDSNGVTHRYKGTGPKNDPNNWEIVPKDSGAPMKGDGKTGRW